MAIWLKGIIRKLSISRGHVLFAVLLLILGILFSFLSCGRTLVSLFNDESPRQDDTSRLEALQQKTQSKFRKMATALELYNVDNDAFPKDLHALTSPIYYISHIPEDPFAADEEIKWTPYAVDDKLYLWSVGPDEIDSEGRIIYDPTNGSMSAGDIIRVIRDIKGENDPLLLRHYRAYDYFSSGENAEKFRTIIKDFTYLSDLINIYVNKSGELPLLITDISQSLDTVSMLPLDPYTQGRNYGYVITETQGTVLLYSIGPDGYDNGGDQLYEGGDPPGGDIVFTLTVRIPDPDQDSEKEEDVMLADLLRLREETGQDNAMIYYQQSGLLELSRPDGEILKNVLRNGWTGENTELLTYIELYQPAFELVREGNAVGYAALPDPAEKGFATLVPDFLSAQIAAKMLCAEARYYEAQADYDRALDNYLTVLEMGQNYSGENALLISGLISVAIKNIAIDRIADTVTSGALTDQQLQEAVNALSEIENSGPLHLEFIKSEYASSALYVAKDRDEYNRVKSDPEKYREFMERNKLNTEYVVTFYETGYLEIMEEFYDAAAEEFSKPYWERDLDEWREKKEKMSMHPWTRIAIPSYENSGARCEISDLKARLAGTAAALERYKNDHGTYPRSLEAVPKYYLPKLPIDPFSGNMLGYVGDSAGYKLYGIGPDGEDNHSAIIYDPTNGTFSAGDIAVESGF